MVKGIIKLGLHCRTKERFPSDYCSHSMIGSLDAKVKIASRCTMQVHTLGKCPVSSALGYVSNGILSSAVLHISDIVEMWVIEGSRVSTLHSQMKRLLCTCSKLL